MTTNPFVIDTELRRSPGESRRAQKSVTLAEKLGTDLLAVPAGETLELDLLLESVMDGILVTGTASGRAEGECVRCLRPLAEELEVEVTELFSYPDTLEEHEQDDDEDPVPVVGDDDTVDLLDVVVDAFVLALPFNPVCREDCAGLCSECGIDLSENPGHEHEAPVDPRWAALGDVAERLSGDNG